jgi:hypothetical protein
VLPPSVVLKIFGELDAPPQIQTIVGLDTDIEAAVPIPVSEPGQSIHCAKLFPDIIIVRNENKITR